MKLCLRSSFILIVLVSAAHLWEPGENPKPLRVCRQKECRERGEWYRANMNTYADPCVDFYEYACGSWSVAQPTPSYAVEWNIQEIQHAKAVAHLRKLLQMPINGTETNYEKQAKLAYQFCAGQPHISRGNSAALEKIIKTINPDGTLSPWVLHNAYLDVTGESPFFMYSVAVNEEENYRIVLEYREPRSAYGSISHFTTWTMKEESSYEGFLMDIYRTFAVVTDYPFNEGTAKRKARQLIDFRYKFNKIIFSNLALANENFTPVTVTELQLWYDQLGPHSAHSNIDWKGITSILYGERSRRVVPTAKMVSLRRKDYFSDLVLLLRETPLDVIIEHIKMYFIERHLIYSDRMLEKLKQTFSTSKQFVGYLLKDTPRWMECIENHEMYHALGKMYIDAYFDTKNIKPIQELVSGLKSVITQQVKEAEWFEGPMMSKAVEEMKRIRTDVGYPDWYFDPRKPVVKDIISPVQANANFNSKKNKIYITAALIDTPMFGLAIPAVINIASMGYTLAHELYHLFGDCGRYPNTGPNIPWWTQDARKHCSENKRCFVEEYNRYSIKELQQFVEVSEIDSERTFVEDVADVMGLKAAHRYVKMYLSTSGKKCEVLPHFEDFTCDQIFFIAFANVMCADVNLKLLSRNYRNMLHNTRRIRVNAAVMHNKEFASAFGCAAHAPMNPSRKCDMWK